MEEVMDFDEWFANFKMPETEYVAVYDPETGRVISVGPSHTFANEKNKISIDKELAESIINADIKIHNCLVDLDSNKLEISEVKTLRKIDDLLHRIISKEYFDGISIDVYLTYTKAEKELEIQLSDVFGGTKNTGTNKKRGIVWDGDTEMNFYITDYNDPNLIFDMFSVKINDLIGNAIVVKNIDFDNFSVYTRRLFKNYVIEYK